MKYSVLGLNYTKSWEGCVLHAYLDTKNYWTIGWGYKGPDVREGLTWTQQQADEKLIEMYFAAWQNAQLWLQNTFPLLNEPRQCVVADMEYNMGFNTVKGFRNCYTAIIAQEFDQAAWQMKWNRIGVPSQYSKDVPRRCNMNATMMLSGLMEKGNV